MVEMGQSWGPRLAGSTDTSSLVCVAHAMRGVQTDAEDEQDETRGWKDQWDGDGDGDDCDGKVTVLVVLLVVGVMVAATWCSSEGTTGRDGNGKYDLVVQMRPTAPLFGGGL